MRAETKPAKVTLLPYYGGAKGNTLKITELANGTVTLEILKNPEQNDTSTELAPSELEMPHLPSRPNSGYGYNIKNIQQTALNIIRLQEAAQKQGQLSEEDEAEYRGNLESLHLSADNLAKIQDHEDEDDIFSNSDRGGLGSWLERKRNTKRDKDKKKEEEKKKIEEEKRKEEEEKRKEEEEKRKEGEEEEEEEEEEKRKKEEKKKEEEEKNKKKKEKEEEEEEEEEEEHQTEDNESIGIAPPPEEASVAEAKPVGLAVAGAGGVAASKPIATAVVGPGGLAIARPVGTAIAGVSPDQALVPIYADGDDPPVNKKESHKKGNKGEQKKKIGASEYLNRIISKYHQV